MSMRAILAASLSAGVAVVAAAPATAAGPPPTVPSDAAIAQYVEALPSATGPAPVGGPAAKASKLPPAVRAKVERTAGADASALLSIAQDPRYGARPAAPAASAPAARPTRTHRPPRRGHAQSRTTHTAAPRPAALSAPTPGPLAAAASTAGSGGLLVVAVLLVAITAAGLATRLQRR